MQAVLWQLTQNILFHPSAEKLVLTHIYSQDWKLYHNNWLLVISHWSLVIGYWLLVIGYCLLVRNKGQMTNDK
jgi:hypothetical protein